MNNTRLQTWPHRLAAFVLTGLFLSLWLQMANANTLDKKPEMADEDSATAARRQQIENIVVAKLKFYSIQYPDINFVILDTAGDVGRNMQALEKIIGEDPDPLDYEHPQDLRYEMLMATRMRIEILLRAELGSATLFKPGTGALATRKRVCVVTMNPWDIAADDRTATEHLLDLPPQESKAIPAKNYLNHVSHLKFALDHEIYHCLDTTYNGPKPMSQRKYWGQYNDFKDESGADTFGILMNIAEHGAITTYARTLRNIRGLTLLGGDIDHYTYKSINAALQIDPVTLRGKNVKALFRMASELRDKIVGRYEDYIRYACAAEQAMKQLGERPDLEQYSGITPDKNMVRSLVSATKDAYQKLTGQVLPAPVATQ